MQIRAVKGTEDLYALEKAQQLEIIGKLRRLAKSFGFQEVEPSALELLSTLTAKSGEEIKKQIWILEKKGFEEVGLRFDLTIGMARMFIAKQKEIPKPIKWFSIGKMWRYEAPQKARAREFGQISFEIFGSDKPIADAEAINFLISAFSTLGLSPRDVVIKINNRKLIEGIISGIVKDPCLIPEICRIIDKTKKLPISELRKELEKLLEAKAVDEILHLIEFKGDPEKALKDLEKHIASLPEEAKIGYGELKALTQFLNKDWIEIDLSIVRGLDYYTGNIFEAYDREMRLRALAGGGRYDNLVEILGGEPLPAVGGAIGLIPLTIFLKEKNKLPKVRLALDYLIAPIGKEALLKAFELANKIREFGFIADIDLMERTLRKQLEHATAIGAEKIIIIGEDEIKKNELTIKNLKTGEQIKVDAEKFLDSLKS